MSENKGIAGSFFVIGDAPLNHYASDAPWSEPPTSGYVFREEIGLPPEETNAPAPKPTIRINLSPDLDMDMLAKHIGETIDKYAAQVRESWRKRPDPVWAEDDEMEDDPFRSIEGLRRFIDARVRKVLEADAREIQENPAFQPVTTINTHEHRRVDMTEESGKQWRGVLYRVDEEQKPDKTPSGTCWACGEHGETMMWYEREGRSHLIHCAVECIRAAESRPETREHRG